MENQLSINPEWQKLMDLLKEISDKLKHHGEQKIEK
jgi:uncharacterized protein YukE